MNLMRQTFERRVLRELSPESLHVRLVAELASLDGVAGLGIERDPGSRFPSVVVLPVHTVVENLESPRLLTLGLVPFEHQEVARTDLRLGKSRFRALRRCSRSA